MKLKSEELLRDRPGVSGTYSCPVHIPVEACLALFQEMGVNPAPKAVGVLGDILENFAIRIVGSHSGKSMSVEQLQTRLKDAIGE